MIHWFNVAWNPLGYPVTWIEIISVFSGIVAVYLAAKEKILTWPLGLINITTAFFIYYHVQLYSDMFLQIYFFGISLYGWWIWKNEQKEKIPLKWLSLQQKYYLIILLTIVSLLTGYLISQLHEYFPSIFEKPAAYPYSDSLVAIASIFANTLMARRYIESWVLWIVIDIICVYLYFQKDILFIALEFLVFLLLAILGWVNWLQLKKKQDLSLQMNHRLG